MDKEARKEVYKKIGSDMNMDEKVMNTIIDKIMALSDLERDSISAITSGLMEKEYDPAMVGALSGLLTDIVYEQKALRNDIDKLLKLYA